MPPRRARRQPLHPIYALTVLRSLAIPLVLAPGGRLSVSPANPQLWGAVFVFVVGALRVNLLRSVALAVPAVALLRTLGWSD